jgi:hypothetical protein
MRAFALFVGLTACVDGFQGSNVQFDFANAMPVQASPGTMPRAGEQPSNGHYSLYAIQEGDTDHLFEAVQFEIHPVVDLSSPCFIDIGDHAAHPGLHVSQYKAQILKDTGITDIANPPPGATEQQKILAATAVQRDANVSALAGPSGMKAVTSASTTDYPAVAPDCNGEAGLIPPPTCTDDPSNQLRLSLCEAAWKADPTYFEGTDLVLTSPLNGTTHGFVDGTNPVNQGAVGGAQFFLNDALVGIDAYAVYFRVDSDTTHTGDLLLFGRPTAPTRGVLHVHLTSQSSSLLTAEMAVFDDLGDDSVHF